MSADTSENPYDLNTNDFAPPGQIALSRAAMEEARQFLSKLAQYEKEAKWIVAFTWCYKRSFQKSPESQSIDEGPGIDLAGYRSSEIPPDAVEVRGGVPLAFIIPSKRLSLATKKEIVETRLPSGRLSYMLV